MPVHMQYLELSGLGSAGDGDDIEEKRKYGFTICFVFNHRLNVSWKSVVDKNATPLAICT